MTKRLLIGAALALVLAGFALWILLRPEAQYEQVYVRGRNVTAWNRLAQVREPAVILRYGERVSVTERARGHAKIRTTNGDIGWVDERQLVAPELWKQAGDLLERARKLPPYATGKTKVVSNLRTEAGRSAPRIYQLPAGVAVEILARAVAEWSLGEGQSSEPQARREDWSLVRAKDEQVGELVGWVLARFIEPDLPAPLHQLGAGIRWMGWHELDRALTEEGEKGQFLGVGVIGPEGQPCDFALLRVYTWNLKRNRYETAYVESNLCARLPVQLIRQGPEVVFSFSNAGRRGDEQRQYRFRQNIVRRVRTGSR